MVHQNQGLAADGEHLNSTAIRRRGLAGEEIPDGEDRLLTVPNLVTAIRFLCIPVFVWLLFGREDHFAAALLLGLLGSTDWVDGYIARHFNQVSNFGKMFDPTVDRILMVVGIGGTIITGLDIRFFTLFAVIVIIREITLSIFVAATVLMGAKRMDVTWIGKCGTFLMMVAFPAFLASTDSRFVDSAAQSGFLILAWTAAIPGLVCSMIAYFGYFPSGIAALKAGRESHAADIEREAGSRPDRSESSDGSQI